MILDSSALVAILLREDGYEVLVEKLGRASQVGIGAPTLVETTVVLSARIERDARAIVARLLQEAAIVTIPFGDDHATVAVGAWLRYGRGRHKANLNFGDCLAYATAKLADRALLCVGNDFARTDLVLA